jgi:hypothetical protein
MFHASLRRLLEDPLTAPYTLCKTVFSGNSSHKERAVEVFTTIIYNRSQIIIDRSQAYEHVTPEISTFDEGFE